MHMDEKALHHFWSRVDKQEADQCWNWKAYTASKTGYPIWKYTDRVSRSPAKTAYELVYGKIPESMVLYRSCNNILCINPDHQVLTTPGAYKSGRIGKTEQRFWSLVARGSTQECWLWLGPKSLNGYGHTCVKMGEKTERYAHRVAYLLTTGSIPESILVCHRCDNPPCCNPAHLFLGTTQDNTADMVKKFRQKGAPGERNSHAKLTAMEVQTIRADLVNGEGISSVARKHGKDRTTIWHIAHGHTWKQGDETPPWGKP